MNVRRVYTPRASMVPPPMAPSAKVRGGDRVYPGDLVKLYYSQISVCEARVLRVIDRDKMVVVAVSAADVRCNRHLATVEGFGSREGFEWPAKDACRAR